MKISIRIATPHDWKIIQKFNNEVFEDNAKYDPFMLDNWAFSKFGIAYYQKITRDKVYSAFIAEVEGKPIGYLVSTKHIRTYRKLKIIEIDNIGVTLKYRSKGIGKALVKHFIRWAKDHGFNAIFVNTYYANKRAINFYQSLGMKPIDMSLEMQI